jgi:uncharacterized protein (DUF58 family)
LLIGPCCFQGSVVYNQVAHDIRDVKIFWRILYHFYRVVSWSRYSAARRFTPAGVGLLIAVVVAGMMGPDTENNVAYQAFALLICFLFVSVAFTWSFRGRFSATRLLPRFGTVGTPLSYRISVRNLTPRIQAGLTLLEDLADPRPSFKEWQRTRAAEERTVRSFRIGQRPRKASFNPALLKPASIPALPPHRQVEVRGELMPLRRGILRFESVTIARPDPLGLFRAFRKVRVPQTTLVLPKRYPLPPISLPGSMRYQAGGVAMASHVGQSEEFVALRDYRYGDPVRHIHWRSWAKTGKPVVREFEDEFFVRHALVLDTFVDYPRSEVFEEAVSIAASFASSVQTQESLLDLLFVGAQSYCFTAGRGLGTSDQMLEILAAVQPCAEKSFSELEHLVFNHIKSVSGCVCVFLAWDEVRKNFVKKLQALGVPVLTLVVAGPGESSRIVPGEAGAACDQFVALEVGKVQQGLASLE